MELRASADRRIVGALLALVLLLGLGGTLGACGGDDDGARAGETATGTTELPPARGPTARIEPGAEEVVRRWADTLRRGDVDGAAELFGLPAVVANGTRPVTLTTRGQLRIFNRSLPCGAVLIDAEPAAHGFVVATFRLTERPGAGSCGSGTGNTARTAFRVQDGLIVYWLRVSDVPPAPAPEEPDDPPAPGSPDESLA